MGQRCSSHHIESGTGTISDPLNLSIVIPALNEASNIGQTINSAKQAHAAEHKTRRHYKAAPEIIVVDGGSTDNTASIAKRHGATVLHSGRGRGRQLNVGWKAARGEWCLMLHADSQLPPGYGALMRNALIRVQGSVAESPVWGCFSTIHTEFSHTLLGRVLSLGVGLRTRMQHTPYGDQAIFVRRSTLKDLGGLAEWPLLEDLDLVQRLNRHHPGGPAIVDAPVLTSGRRWSKLGFWRTYALNQQILIGHRLGVDVETLAQWYRNAGSSGTGTTQA